MGEDSISEKPYDWAEALEQFDKEEVNPKHQEIEDTVKRFRRNVGFVAPELQDVRWHEFIEALKAII